MHSHTGNSCYQHQAPSRELSLTSVEGTLCSPEMLLSLRMTAASQRRAGWCDGFGLEPAVRQAGNCGIKYVSDKALESLTDRERKIYLSCAAKLSKTLWPEKKVNHSWDFVVLIFATGEQTLIPSLTLPISLSCQNATFFVWKTLSCLTL